MFCWFVSGKTGVGYKSPWWSPHIWQLYKPRIHPRRYEDLDTASSCDFFTSESDFEALARVDVYTLGSINTKLLFLSSFIENIWTRTATLESKKITCVSIVSTHTRRSRYINFFSSLFRFDSIPIHIKKGNYNLSSLFVTLLPIKGILFVLFRVLSGNERETTSAACRTLHGFLGSTRFKQGVTTNANVSILVT